MSRSALWKNIRTLQAANSEHENELSGLRRLSKKDQGVLAQDLLQHFHATECNVWLSRWI